uniref:Regulator of G-protein signaling 7 n=1 Tax=Trichogramma kaykai TaxID=54128 RepID=A0ABD2WLJ1_9HYME
MVTATMSADKSTSSTSQAVAIATTSSSSSTTANSQDESKTTAVAAAATAGLDRTASQQQQKTNNSGAVSKQQPRTQSAANLLVPPTLAFTAQAHPAVLTAPAPQDSPNYLTYKKMEALIGRMQNEENGVPVRTVKTFMTKIPSIFTGTDLITWMMKNMDVDDQEALHVAHLMAAYGYLFPIDDHCLSVKNDNTFYRFQTPYFWPSNCWEPENTDYAVYLWKRTMQHKARLELADYEAEYLARLQKLFSRKWEFIDMQADAQNKADKKRDKLERKVLDSQERAFWDVHRPMPGCVNTTELDIKKVCRSQGRPTSSSGACQHSGPLRKLVNRSVDELRHEIELLKLRLDRRIIKISKVAEALINYSLQYAEYDPFFTVPEATNPWITDSLDFWEQEKAPKDVPLRRVKRWAFSLQELLQDPVGREQFIKFLDKEFSGENLRFWEAVRDLKTLPRRQVEQQVKFIWDEYMADEAPCPVNVDSKSLEITKKNFKERPDQWCYDVAAVTNIFQAPHAHVYHLMKTDSYSRYLRSDMYKDFLNNSKKKASVKGIRSIVSFTGRKDPQAV